MSAAADLYCLSNSRTEQQAEQMRRLAGEGRCVFCPDGGAQVVHAGAHWRVIRNIYPYRDAALHLLIVPNQHVTHPHELRWTVTDEFWDVLERTLSLHHIDDYEIRIRCGDPRRTGATIAHLHAHVIVRAAS